MKKKLIILGISLLIIIIGIIMACTLKFNMGLNYGSYTMLNIYMTGESNLDDVKQLVEETCGGTYSVEYTDEFNDTVSIKLKNISEEELTNLQDKIKEKYEFDEDSDNILVIDVPKISLYDLVKDYILPVIISFAIIIIYYAIALRKLGMFKSIVEPVLTIVIIGVMYISILAICRIPINEYVVPLGVFIYIISLLGITVNLNNKNKEITSKKTR